jgi:feruloyl esterase
MKTLLSGLCVVLLGCVVSAQGYVGDTSACEKLAGLSLLNTKITLAQAVTTGSVTLPAAPVPTGSPAGPPRTFADLPAFCRVAATVMPSVDSDIKIEVWLPLVDWNRKFMAAGNGGWNGSVNYGQMVPILRRGYAVASTDTGHQSGQEARWAMGHPEKQIDFGYRAVHEMTLRAKEIVNAFYGAALRYAYWNGCSSGGKQGLKEAQRFPADYDGIIAGAPANYWTHLVSQILDVAQAVRKDDSTRIPTANIPSSTTPYSNNAMRVTA